MNQQESQKPARMKKFEAINQSISNVTKATTHLCVFINELKGEINPPSTDSTKEPIASLEETLNSAPEKLNVIADIIERSIEEMRKILF